MGSGSGSSQGPPGRRMTGEANWSLGRRGWAAGSGVVALPNAYCLLPVSDLAQPFVTAFCTGIGHENDQAGRAISTGKLNALLRLHTRPIDVVVFHGSSGRTRFEVGFPLRCL